MSELRFNDGKEVFEVFGRPGGTREGGLSISLPTYKYPVEISGTNKNGIDTLNIRVVDDVIFLEFVQEILTDTTKQGTIKFRGHQLTYRYGHLTQCPSQEIVESFVCASVKSVTAVGWADYLNYTVE